MGAASLLFGCMLGDTVDKEGLETCNAGVGCGGVGASVTLGDPRCAESKTRMDEIHLISSSSEGAQTI